MFENIGEKIKMSAKVLCWVGIIVSVVYGIVYMVSTEFWDFGIIYFFISVLIMVVGSLLSWVSSLGLYGFGELVDNVSDIASKK